MSSIRWNKTIPDPLIILGQSIRKAREQLSLSQESLADKCGFDRTYISMLERGKRNPTLLNLLKLSHGLGISVSTLTEIFDGTKPN